MGGRYTATTQGIFEGEGSVALAVAHPWASASSYLSSQSVAAGLTLVPVPLLRRQHPRSCDRTTSCTLGAATVVLRRLARPPRAAAGAPAACRALFA